MKKINRRSFIASGISTYLGLSLVSPSGLFAGEPASVMFKPLIDTLRATKKPVCESVANMLQRFNDNRPDYDLHLRSADLNNDEIRLIAQAIKLVAAKGGPSLRSFSMSYNPHLGDEGVFDLVKSLPHTITEIGLVGCGIRDKGGDALLAWAPRAPKLHWLCVEQNSFSDRVKNNFVAFGNETHGLLVVV